jgi:hypothetical protein
MLTHAQLERRSDRAYAHAAALKAAAKVAFSMVLLEGCSSPGVLAGQTTTEDEASSSEPAVAAEEQPKSDRAVPSDPKAPSRTRKSLGKKPSTEAGSTAPSCNATLAASFPVPGDYQWEPVAQSKEVVACCDQELTKNGAGSTYRWDCCVAYDPEIDAGGQGLRSHGHDMACTPWGPPVPPSMRSTRARSLTGTRTHGRARLADSAEIAAWLAKAVA